ncbi:MAG: hypothetical protein K1X55_13405 [Chitinophagales bacterium]|nr:hypothetical protein [Chitinophagales bacterium]
MTSEQFETFWLSTYPETIPIAYNFKHCYKDRWFRIHSLPESQRYPNTNQEWHILLSRQNRIITDIIGDSTQLFIVTGEYDFDGTFDSPDVLNTELLSDFKFKSLKPIDLYKIDSKEYDKGTIYRPFFAEVKWEQNKYDKILCSIANDEMRAFFVSMENKCLIAPYDGGLDLVLENSAIKDYYKTKYKDWLSLHIEGL